MKTSTQVVDTPRLYPHPSAWYGKDMVKRNDWVHPLTPTEVGELKGAAARFIDTGADLTAMTMADFPLPTLGARLAAIRKSVLHGTGVALLRGWPIDTSTLHDSATAFYGIGTHLGTAISQNGKGHVLGHVANLGKDYSDPSTRGYQTKAELKFHTDGGDIVGLLCVRPGRSGGLSRVASSTTIWNEIVSKRPDLAHVLQSPFWFSKVGEVNAGESRAYATPLYCDCDGRLIAFLVQSMIQKAQDFPEVPLLTEAQRDALALLEVMANDPAIRLDMDFKPGDMQFLLNHSVFHSRTAYEDWPEPERRRHLLRLWLSSDDGPRLPDDFKGATRGRSPSGRPLGISLDGVAKVAPMEPC